MEFCPEVAVLQSAFQLVQSKAGKKLACLTKSECSNYVLILKTTLEEICQGLECDLDLQEQLLWQQNMHTLILYGLIKKTYKTVEKKSGMPVFSSLDVLVQVLPQLSKHLYIELIKECSWQNLMIDCLPYLESSLASQLLLDVIEHCTEEPVTSGDNMVITSIRETVIEKLLYVPYEVDSLLEKQLKPLSRPDKYVPLSRDDQDELDVLSVHERSKVSGTIDSEQKEELEEDEEPEKLSDVKQHFDQAEVSTEQTTDRGQDTETDVAKAAICRDKEIKSNEKVKADNSNNKNESFGMSDLTYDRQFWHKFLCENPIIFETLVLNTENNVKNIARDTDHLGFLAQLGLLGFITMYRNEGSSPAESETLLPLGKDIDIPSRWLVYNLVLENHQKISRTTYLPEINPVYIVDRSIADELSKQISAKNWITYLHTVLKCAIDRFQSADPVSEQIQKDSNKSSYVTDNIGSYVHVVSGLCLHKNVLCRIIEGCLSDIENNASSDVDLPLHDCKVMLTQLLNTKASYKLVDELPDKVEPEEKVEFGKYQTDSSETYVRNSAELGSLSSEIEENTLMFGDSWKSDVSLEALCWRIKYRLPYYQECVEELLQPRCQEFWLNERVYDAFCDNVALLAIKERVMNLMYILRNIQSAPGEITLKAKQLTCAAFSGLSFMNQDSVAMEMYTRDESLRDYLGLQDMQTMTVFNRITALRDDQILSELFQLCLCDPRDVITTAVRMSVRNKEQATNLAQVLQFFPKICQSKHPTHHPHSSLLGNVISEFLCTTTLTDKEQAAFVVFLNTLLQVPNNSWKVPLLSAVELMEQSILPFIGVHTLYNSGQVSCKFALTMLKAVLEHGCCESNDWVEFEPMGLVLCLAELIQDCVVFWDSEDTVSGQMKISVKSLVLECFKILGDVTCKENMLPKGILTVESLYHCMAEMDLQVVMRVQEAMGLLNIIEYNQDHKKALDELQKLPSKHPATILVIASMSGDETLQLELTEAIGRRGGQLAYDDIIVALIQVLPNMLSLEFERAVKYVMTLIEKELLPVPYRSGNTCHLPLTGIRGCEPTLGASQILRDVIITLGYLTDRSDMLQHVLQCYTACLKSHTNTITPKSSKPEVDLFLVSQLFLHVSDIVHLLPQQSTEPVLVLLLHLLTLYTDILDSSLHWVTRQKWRERMVEGITNAIQLSVDSLPDSLVEKEMLLKKII